MRRSLWQMAGVMAHAGSHSVVATLLAVAVVACGEPVDEAPPARALHALTWPGPVLRAGTRIFVSGRGAAGARLLLRDASAQTVLSAELGLAEPLGTKRPPTLPADAQIAGGSISVGPDDSPVDGSQLTEACLVAAGATAVGDQDDCMSVTATWRSGLLALTPQIAGGERRFGDDLPVEATVKAELLLPGEGQDWLDVVTVSAPAPAQATASVALLPVVDRAGEGTWLALHGQPGLDRGHRNVQLEPSWLGPAPGTRKLRMRIRQRAGEVEVAGPWVDVTLQLAPPQLSLPAAAERVLQRGRLVPASVTGVPVQDGVQGASGWRLLISGAWKGAAISWPETSPRRLPGTWSGTIEAPVHRALLSSAAWFEGGWAEVEVPGQQPELQGALAVEIFSPAGTWRSPPTASSWRLEATTQRVDLRFGAGYVAGLQRFGLVVRAGFIEARVRALVADSFDGLRVTLLQATETPPLAEEVLRAAILDRDPNGLDLLGADSSPGKDTGNLDLGEQLLGFGAASRVAGEVAYGGVFLHGFARFSPSLYPAGLVVDPVFDEIFSPWMPELGGQPAKASDAASDPASEIMARLIAGSLSHELGHALGLPAVPGYHHLKDNPGWRMDQGRFRPFAERVALPGAQKQVWGPVDGAYLQTVLGNDKR